MELVPILWGEIFERDILVGWMFCGGNYGDEIYMEPLGSILGRTSKISAVEQAFYFDQL